MTAHLHLAGQEPSDRCETHGSDVPATHLVDFRDGSQAFAVCAECAAEATDRGLGTATLRGAPA